MIIVQRFNNDYKFDVFIIAMCIVSAIVIIITIIIIIIIIIW